MTFTITYSWNSLIRRSFLENAQLRFNPNLTAQEDLLFIVEIFINGAKGILIKEPTYVYRFGRDGSLTSINSNLTPNEIAKRKKLLRSMIDCSKCLKRVDSCSSSNKRPNPKRDFLKFNRMYWWVFLFIPR